MAHAQQIKLDAELRTELGTAASRRLRRLENKIPATVYGAKKENINLCLDHNKMIKVLKNEAFYSSILTIHVNDKKVKAVVKEIHRHPYKPKILHMDFQRISAKQKLTMGVPIHYVGEDVSPGVKQGGIVSRIETSVEVSCLPSALPEYLEIDISNLRLDHTLRLSDIKVPEDVDIVDLLHDNDRSVVSIHLPKIAEGPRETEEAPETEVIKEKGGKEKGE